MGREAKEMKWRMFGGDWARGPWLKEKRRSLKVASQTRKKVVGPPRWKEERLKGRMRKRSRIGRRERSLKKPFGILEAM